MSEPASAPLAPGSAGPVPRPGKPSRPIRRLVRRAAVLLASTYLGACVVLYFLQSKLIYHPFAELETTPAAHGMEYEDVTFQAADGVRLNGWYVRAQTPAGQAARGVILFCHGNAGNISHRIDTLHLLTSLEMDVFLFDYRGYGLSEGKPSEEGTHLDARAAWEYLVERRKVEPGRIVVFGRSLGGSVAAHLAARLCSGAGEGGNAGKMGKAGGAGPCGLVVESSFTSIPDLGQELYWFLPIRWLARFQYDTRGALADVRCPVLVIHSREDRLIPYRHGQRLFEAASQPKTFLEIHGGHNDGWFLSQDSGYREGVREFCHRCLDHTGRQE